MYTLFNIETRKRTNFTSEAEMIHTVRTIAVENEDFDLSIVSRSEAIEYIEDYCEDTFILLEDSEIDSFIAEFGTEVQENEKSSYVELMMDDHICCLWNDVAYYVKEDADYTEEEEKAFSALAYCCHV